MQNDENILLVAEVVSTATTNITVTNDLASSGKQSSNGEEATRSHLVIIIAIAAVVLALMSQPIAMGWVATAEWRVEHTPWLATSAERRSHETAQTLSQAARTIASHWHTVDSPTDVAR